MSISVLAPPLPPTPTPGIAAHSPEALATSKDNPHTGVDHFFLREGHEFHSWCLFAFSHLLPPLKSLLFATENQIAILTHNLPKKLCRLKSQG